jgi:hypothetical protein
MTFEQSTTRICWISDQHPDVEVQLAIRIETPGNLYYSVETHIDPQLLPESENDTLFFKGISEGVNAGVVDANFPLHESDVKVEITTFNTSTPLSALNQEELQKLGMALREVAYDLTVDLLTQAKKSASYSS